jgi:hypothetical protein
MRDSWSAWRLMAFLGALMLAGWFVSAGVLRNGGVQEVGSVRFEDLVGTVLSDFFLQTPAGEVVSASALFSTEPAVLYFVTDKNIYNCAQFPLEMKILSREHPHIQQALIASGRDTAAILRFVKLHRITEHSYFDPEEEVSRVLGVSVHGPAILLTARGGEVLLADTRSGGRFSHFPISRVLLQLERVLRRDGEDPLS